MRTVKDTKDYDNGDRLLIFDDGSATMQHLVPGKIISINDKTSAGTNSNGKEFYIGTVKAEINGKDKVGSALIWGNQLHSDKLGEGTWAPGAPIMLAITKFEVRNGETIFTNKNKASIQLPGGSTTDWDLPEVDAKAMADLEKMGIKLELQA